MKQPRLFYLQADNKDIQTFEYFASDTPCYDNDIKVIELTPLTKAAPEMLDALERLESELIDADLEIPEYLTDIIQKAKGLNPQDEDQDPNAHLDITLDTKRGK